MRALLVAIFALLLSAAILFTAKNIFQPETPQPEIPQPEIPQPEAPEQEVPPPIPVVAPPKFLVDMSGIPRQCLEYTETIILETRGTWGFEGYPATFGAQIQQESACKPNAVSRVGAQGLAQFMPATSKWFGQEIMKEDPAPLDPDWAIRAMVQYNHHLWKQVSANDSCNRMAKTLSAYNGGLGWVRKDEKLAHTKGLDKSIWFDNVEEVNSGRSAANFKENRGYPRRILWKLEPSYIRAGYGNGSCNDASS